MLMYKSGYLHKTKNTTTVYMVCILARGECLLCYIQKFGCSISVACATAFVFIAVAIIGKMILEWSENHCWNLKIIILL